MAHHEQCQAPCLSPTIIVPNGCWKQNWETRQKNWTLSQESIQNYFHFFLSTTFLNIFQKHFWDNYAGFFSGAQTAAVVVCWSCPPCEQPWRMLVSHSAHKAAAERATMTKAWSNQNEVWARVVCHWLTSRLHQAPFYAGETWSQCCWNLIATFAQKFCCQSSKCQQNKISNKALMLDNLNSHYASINFHEVWVYKSDSTADSKMLYKMNKLPEICNCTKTAALQKKRLSSGTAAVLAESTASVDQYIQVWFGIS